MENNKAYLKNFPWVFAIAVISSVLTVFQESWIGLLMESYRYRYIAIYGLSLTLIFVSLGILTSRWKEAAAAVVLTAVYYVVQASMFSGELVVWKQVALHFIFPLPLFAFIILNPGSRKKAGWVYLLCFLTANIYSMGFAAMQGLDQLFSFTERYPLYLQQIITVLFSTASFSIAILIICEALNLAKGKSIDNKSRLLNLGNEYEKAPAILVFWVLKTNLLLLVLGIFSLEFYYARFIYDYGADSALSIYYRFNGIVDILCLIAGGLFTIWYLRKLMLECFAAYNIRSKFSYWFSLLPVLGLISFMVLLAEAVKQVKYRDKANSLIAFASANATPVSAMLYIFAGLRILLQLSSPQPLMIASSVLGIFLLAWTINQKSGYVFNMTLNVIVLSISFLAIFVFSTNSPLFAILLPLMMYNIAHLGLIFPVYYLEDFEYIPDTDPEPQEGEEFHLF